MAETGRPTRGGRWQRRPDRAVARGSSSGSASAELVILAPVLVALMGLVTATGQVLRADEAVADAARSAAESAVVANDPAAAGPAASADARAVLRGDGVNCSPLVVGTDTTDFTPGGSVSVTVSCDTRLGSLSFLPFPGSFTVEARSEAVVEPFREVAG